MCNSPNPMLINNDLLDSLTAQAKASPRLRQHYDLRDSEKDGSQRMLNALEPGTVLPIHRHPNSSETVVVLRGKVKWFYYDDEGSATDAFMLESQGGICGLNIPKGQWHSLECLECGTVILSCKDGRWKALAEEDILG